MEVRNAQLDTSTTGNLYSEATGGVELSEAKQTWWGMIGAISSPRQTFNKVADYYHDEWITSNVPGKIGVVWRGALDMVLGAKVVDTAAKVGKVGTLATKAAAEAGKLGTRTQGVALRAGAGLEKMGEKVAGVTAPIVEAVGGVIPEGIKTVAGKTGEQFRIRGVDNPLDSAARDLALKSKVARRPSHIPETDWKRMATDYRYMNVRQLEKAHGVHKFLESHGVSLRHQKDVVSSGQIDTMEFEVTTTDTSVYRYYGGRSGERSHWVTEQWIDTPAERISSFNLPSSNFADKVKNFTIPAGQPIVRSTVGQCFGAKASKCSQIYVLDKSSLR